MLGWLFAAAILVGGILDDDYKNLLRWAFAGVVYVAMQELARHTLVGQMTETHHNMASVVSAITLIVYTLGLALGWGIVALAKIKAHRQFAAYQANLENTLAQDAPSEEVL
jgi:hypothetical protein